MTQSAIVLGRLLLFLNNRLVVSECVFVSRFVSYLRAVLSVCSSYTALERRSCVPNHFCSTYSHSILLVAGTQVASSTTKMQYDLQHVSLYDQCSPAAGTVHEETVT